MIDAMRGLSGCLWVEAAHSGPLERAILSWWSGREAIEAWYEHPAHRAIVTYGYEQGELLESGAVKTWIEFYEPVRLDEARRERAVVLIGGLENPPCLERRSLSTGIHRFDFAWVEPGAIVATPNLLMRQLDWGVRTSADAGAPFSKARVLDTQKPANRYARSVRRRRAG